MKLFDATLTSLERSLDVRLSRHNVLSGNIANVDTPGYKPKDVDFAATMSALSGGGASGASTSVETTNLAHLNAASGTGVGGTMDGDVPVIEVAGESPNLDGNGVDLDRTMASLAENGMQYGASARAAGKKLSILRYVAGDGNG
jgi:flagellar basal-body rod protein FlgB